MPTVLLTGATGYVGGRLAPRLAGAADASDGAELRLMMRRPDPAKAPAGARVRVVQGDAVSGEGVAAALDGVDVAYYLIHSMGRGGGADFEARDRRAAAGFGRAAAAAGVRRVIYLGGLSSEDASSAHLRSRDEVAELLGEHVPEFVHVRAAMVIGAGSASFQMLRALVRRLPAMICPRWIDTRTQPIAIDDVVAALAQVGARHDVTGDVQLGGPAPLTYRAMMDRTADAMGRRHPLVVRVPVLTPRLSSYWVQLVTPVEAALVRPLVDGLREEMLVHEPPPPGINAAPRDFDAAVRSALDGR
ncbi:NAD(P)H-binding protein [Conexibacter sp. CPCC 206217]|uniref:NAD(P)H-binding protein n=1 Tax=Conexibacter sp. CPCC 206217 TaxID=3064574 RepID=UPI0027207730|nr:NAD(P)H-binding protein [Conexibacter sp. CPCC 206217]MDO8212977.1 NAD(P)H-binding protein [Conexibacter sp. CPCC 206217]